MSDLAAAFRNVRYWRDRREIRSVWNGCPRSNRQLESDYQSVDLPARKGPPSRFEMIIDLQRYTCYLRNLRLWGPSIAGKCYADWWAMQQRAQGIPSRFRF